MADTFYSWSNFNVLKDDKVTKIKPGDTVSPSTLNVPQEEFDAYVESGAVRTTKYPDLPNGFTGSPREFRLAQLAAAAAGEDYDVTIAALGGEAFAEVPAPATDKK